MGKYDAVLKTILQRWGSTVLMDVIREPLDEWITIEMPQVSVQFADLLARTSSGRLFQVELQASNDPTMPARMLEYASRVYRQFGRVPKQVVLYVGRDPLRMRREVTGEDLSFRYEILNAADMNPEDLLSSRSVSDNVMAILTRLRNSREAVRRILEKVAALNVAERAVALEALILLSGLRELEETVEAEAKTMPVFDDILDNKVLGREYKRGHERGVEEGLEKGVEKGRHAEALSLLRMLIVDRFGPIPASAESKLSLMSAPELEGLARRVLRAGGLDELLG